MDKSVAAWHVQPMAALKSVAQAWDVLKEAKHPSTGLPLGLPPVGQIFEVIAKLPDDGEGVGGFTAMAPASAASALRISASQLKALVKAFGEAQSRMNMGSGDDDEEE